MYIVILSSAIKKSHVIDYDSLEKSAIEFTPQVIFGGGMTYSRDIDWQRLRKIADKSGSVLVANISSTAGLIATGHLSSPFKFTDVVITSSSGSLRGPKGAMIFYKVGLKG